MNPLGSVSPCPLPSGAALEAYSAQGAYTDCYAIRVPRVISQAEYVAAFYTTWVFKIERALLALLLSRPSTDAEAWQLAQGEANTFSVWTVERRESEQILLAAGRTRLWLMTCPARESGAIGTTLYFGSAVVPRRDPRAPDMGWHINALLAFHKLYSRILLSAASRRLRANASA